MSVQPPTSSGRAVGWANTEQAPGRSAPIGHLSAGTDPWRAAHHHYLARKSRRWRPGETPGARSTEPRHTSGPALRAGIVCLYPEGLAELDRLSTVAPRR